MPAFTFTSPEGKKFTVRGPDGARGEQAFAILQQHLVDDDPTAEDARHAAAFNAARRVEPKTGSTLADQADAFVRGAANALTFGFADRLAAGAGAATGIGGKFGDYSGNLAAQRGLDKANLKEHPVASIGGAVAGGMALPIGAASQAATLPGRMAAGVGVGAGQGAIYGVGSSPDIGNVGEMAGNAATGALTGAAIGGGAPAVLSGGRAVVGGLRALGPEARAAKTVSKTMADMTPDQRRATLSADARCKSRRRTS